MLRHSGSQRTFKHNIYLATTLSIVAGIVNVTGWTALGILTTNVTGHFVLLSEQILAENLQMTIGFLLLIFAFLFGAFMSSVFMETSRNKAREHFVSYVVPISLEIFVLVFVALSDMFLKPFEDYVLLLAMLLLFSMGMQNALVTQVSNSIVRTTHLTGLFTDMGIEMSQYIFYKGKEDRKHLRRSVFLRMLIVIGFTLGGIIAGYMYSTYQMKTLFVSIIILVLILALDNYYIAYYVKRLNKRLIRVGLHYTIDDDKE